MNPGIKNKADLLLSLLYAGENHLESKQQSTSIVGITRLEKLLFLLKLEEGFLSRVDDPSKDDFHFVPFRMGPWTAEVYDEVDFLESLGLLKKKEERNRNPADAVHDDELFNEVVLDKYQKQAASLDDESEEFSLTGEGKEKAYKIWKALSDEEKSRIIKIKRQFNNMNLRQFLRYVYKKHPEYTTESEIKEYLFREGFPK